MIQVQVLPHHSYVSSQTIIDNINYLFACDGHIYAPSDLIRNIGCVVK